MRDEDQADALEKELADEEKTLLDGLAEGITRRRLTSAAIFFLESVKPLGFLASQTMHFFRPIVQTIWTNPQTWDRVAKLLERRGAIELLLRRLEARA